MIKEINVAAYVGDMDISLEPITECNKSTNANVWLVSYAKGEVHIRNQDALTISAVNKCVDFYKPYTEKHIESSYFRAHKSILSQKRGAGYWLWKPYLILKTLKEIPENDIVFYVDSGTMIIKPIDSLVNHLSDNDIVVFKNHHKNKGYVKHTLLNMMNIANNKALNAYQLQASFILIKNTPHARKFIEKWLEWCENEDALTDSAPTPAEYYNYVEHRHDQSILSLLYLQNPERIVVRPYEEVGEYFLHHRRRKIDHKFLWFLKQKVDEWQRLPVYKK